MFTMSGAAAGAGVGMLPLTPPVYSVEVSDPLLATHNGLVPISDCPHGLTRFGSVMRATPGMSEIRFVWVYSFVVSPRLLAIGTATAPAATKAARASQTGRRREVDPRVTSLLLSSGRPG